MSTPNTTVLPKRPGRPHKSPLASPQVRAWFWAVSARARKSSGYALEKFFSEEKIKRRDGIVVRPCKFDKYKRGEHIPSPTLVDKVETELPNTKRWLIHPFWKIASTTTDNIDINVLYELLYTLRPEIRDLLFFHNTSFPQRLMRRPENGFELLKKFNKESDLDALTACIGVLKELEYFDINYLIYFAPKIILKIFRRAFCVSPLYIVANDVFQYLKYEYLLIPGEDDWNIHVHSHNPISLIEHYQILLCIFEDLGLLNDYPYKSLNCLYLADKYFNKETYVKINHFFSRGEHGELLKLPEIRKFKRRIRNKNTNHISHAQD